LHQMLFRHSKKEQMPELRNFGASDPAFDRARPF
jgi:hypothetical protein